VRSCIVFSGTGPILIVTSYPELTDERFIERLGHKGITKFIAYEVPLERVRAAYGLSFDVIAGELERAPSVRVLDVNGHHIFSCFQLAELGEPIKVGD
jgi:hypothetical protein